MANAAKIEQIKPSDTYLTDRKRDDGSPLVFIVEEIYSFGGIGGSLAALDDPGRWPIDWIEVTQGEMSTWGWALIADAALPAYTHRKNVPDEISLAIRSQQDKFRFRINRISGNRAQDLIGVATEYSKIITPKIRSILAQVYDHPLFADRGIEEFLELEPQIVAADADFAKKISTIMNAWDNALEAAWAPFKILAMRRSRLDKWPSLRRKSGFPFDRAWYWVAVDGAQWGIRIDTTSGAPQLEHTKPPRFKGTSQPSRNR